jgi:hypothetical protein
MVGKLNFPNDVDQRDDLHGHAMPTPGLTALDEEREASMADEGGRSGAVMETQSDDPGATTRSPTAHRPYPQVTQQGRRLGARLATVPRGVWVALALGGVAIGAAGLAWVAVEREWV